MTPPPDPIEVPWRELAPRTLRALLEEFVSRPGTDYGERERSLDEKVADVMRQLERREARVFYDPDSETTTVATVDPREAR